MGRRRRYRDSKRTPIAYPGWRVWEDRRVRINDAVMAVVFSTRIARNDLAARAAGNPDSFVCDLYGVEELPYRQSFRVTPAYARERWVRGVEEITRQTNVLGVTLIDDLLGSTIKLLRETGDLPEPPGQSDTGLSSKLDHLVDVAGLKVDPGTVSLHRLCLAIRNSVVHDGARQMKVISAWEKLENPEREWWTSHAGEPLRLTNGHDELVMDERELMAAFSTWDRITLEVNEALRDLIDEQHWAELIVKEYRAIAPGKASDPGQNVGAAQRFGQKEWRVEISSEAIEEALR